MRVTLHELSAEDMQPLLLQRKLDVALTVLLYKLSPALDMQEVARYETCVAGLGATHPLAKAKFVSLKQVASEPVATYARKDYPADDKHLEKMFASVGRQPRIGSEHDSGSSLIAAVAAGQEFALLPSSVRSAAGARLKFLKLRPALPPWLIVALWRKDAKTEPVRAFVAAATSKPGRKTARRFAQVQPANWWQRSLIGRAEPEVTKSQESWYFSDQKTAPISGDKETKWTVALFSSRA